MRKSHYTQIGKEMDWHPLEQGVFGDAGKIKIAVVGIGREAGASFVAASLAYHLAKHVDGVTYMEAEDAQIAETLAGRQQACYSLGLYRALGFAGPLGRNREPDRPPEPDRNRKPNRPPEPDRKRKRDCDRALGLKHPTEPGRDQTYTADRNRESARPRDHDRQQASEWLAEPSRLPEHGRPSDVLSMRGRRGKFTDYFALEKEGLSVSSRRNLYANVNWAVRAPLGAAPLEAVPFGNSALETSALSETCSESKRHARFRTPRPAASEPCMLAAPQGIGRIPGRYMIVDNPRPESLWEADVVICVVDPLPSRLRSEIRQLEALRDNQIRFGKRFSPLLNLPTSVLWVLNKDNPQVKHRELERSLNIKFDFAVPLLSTEIFYKAEYSSVPIFQMVEAAVRPHPSGSSDKQRTRTHPLAPQGADGCGGSPHSCCDTGAGKAGGRGFWQTGRAPAGASARGSSGQPRSGCAAACSEFGRLAKSVLKLLD